MTRMEMVMTVIQVPLPNPERRQLNRPSYTVPEVAYILGVEVRTVREYITKKKSRKDDRLPRLQATKEGSMWKVSREALQRFLDEEYGP